MSAAMSADTGLHMQDQDLTEAKPAGHGAFPATRWSLVSMVRARHGDEPQAARALEHLCGIYWDPLYAFARRQGMGPEDAQDATQGFFERLIDKHTFHAADRERGRLRTFLLAAFGHFLADERDRRNAWRRGGRTEMVSLDAGGRYDAEADMELTPERYFNRQWALAILRQALDALETERNQAGREREWSVLRKFLDASGSVGETSYEDAAASLDWSVNATRVAVHRLRLRYRQLLQDQIASTLENEDPAMVRDEMQALLAALA
jgi:RNA polymerase sigma-70 factor (ECF subfamily)